MYKFICFLCLFLSAWCTHASVLEAYQLERQRLLQVPYEQRLAALHKHSFDLTTPLGRYFYNTVHTNTIKDIPYFKLSQADIASLREDYPQVYYEREVFETWFSTLDSEQKIQQLRQIKIMARDKSWPRIERWATSILIEVLQSNGFYLSAILEMQDVIPHAPHIEKMETMYDYPLIAAYMDMSRSLYWLGDYAGALEYCRKYTQYLQNDPQVAEEGLICQIAASLKLADFDTVFGLIRQLSLLADTSGLKQTRVAALLYTALAYREQEFYSLTLNYANDALSLLQNSAANTPGSLYTVYLLLTSAHIGLGNTDLALHNYALMQKARTPVQQGIRYDIDATLAQARIASLQQNFSTAQEHYERVISLYKQQHGQGFSASHLNDITRRLDSQQLSYLQVEARLHQAQSEKMTLLAIFSSFFALVAGILLWRLFRHKKQIESFSRIDSLTGISNRWYALDSIKTRLTTMNRVEDVVCVAILDIDHFKSINDQFGHQAGDAVLTLFAKICKYQFRQDDVFGRYGGEEFVLLLNQSKLEQGVAKIAELRNMIAAQDLTESGAQGSLRFSCGLVEVSGKADISTVLAHCDSLLYTAKRNGRNQTSASIFGQTYTRAEV